MSDTRMKSILKNMIKIAVSVVLVVILYINIDLEYVMQEVMNTTPRLLAGIIVLATIGMGIEVFKWRVLLPGVSFVPITKAYMYGNFFTLALPGQLFGEAAKIAAFGKFTNGYDRSVSTVAIDKMTGLTGLMMFGLFGLTFTRAELPIAFVGIMIAFIVFAAGVIFSMRAKIIREGFLSFIEFLRKKTHKFETFCDNAAGVITTWHEYLYQPGMLLRSIAYGLLLDAVSVLQYVLVSRQYGIAVSWIDLCWILPMINVVQSLPISMAGIGVRDVSLVALFTYIGVSAEIAMIPAVFMLIVIIYRAICGAACLLWDIAGARIQIGASRKENSDEQQA